MITTTPTIKDQELSSFGLVESASVNSITDFVPSKLNSGEVNLEKDDFVNIFICHLIFYGFLCVSLVLHILIDLGFGSFIKNKLVELIGFGKKTVFEKGPAFA
tara:strand:+ start:193 stop:501 length:309 start_codon:yes stop_codon:yes gene_type:complete